MRLTLRTMLAYLDDILDPEDAADIGRKIEESEVAKTLVRRIREITRRLRIGAPPVLDDKPLLDPNTAAEYLDNTLPPDRVADFEKACLENDTQLAEVAACHQILSIVLGEPAEVSPATRDAVYRLLGAAKEPSDKDIVRSLFQEAKEAPNTTAASPEHSPAASSDHSAASIEPFVPGVTEADHRHWFFPSLMTLALVGTLVLVGVWLFRNQFAGLPSFFNNPETAMQSPRPGHGETGEGATREDAPAGVDATSRPRQTEWAERPSPAQSVPGASPTDELAASISKPRVDSSDTPESAPIPAEQNPPPSDRPIQEVPDGSPPVPSDAVPGLRPDAPMRPEETAAANPQAPGPAQEQAPGPPVGMRPLPPAPPADVPSAIRQPGEIDPSAVPPNPLPSTDSAPLPPEPVGEFAPDGRLPQMLLRLMDNSGNVKPVHAAEKLNSYERYFVPPGFRARVLLSGVELVGIGPLFFEILSTDAAGSDGLELSYGKMILNARVHDGGDQVGPPTLRLKFGNLAGLLQLRENASVGLDVTREDTVSNDPETQPIPWIVDLYVLEGEVVWGDSDHSRPMTLVPQVQVRLSERELRTVPLAGPVAWLNPPISAERLLEENAMGLVTDALSGDGKPPLMVLEELSHNRRQEVAWLAQRTLAFLGFPGPLWRTLNDPAAKARWTPTIEQLLTVVRQSPQSAAAVRASAEAEFGERGPDLYALLWKYGATLDQAQAGKLISLLEHDHLAVRVLAFWNLRRVTGVTLNYEPNAVPVERQRAIRLWRTRLEGPAGLPNVSDRS
ncbi:MAG: hypothetical protein ACUVTW_12465 [Thermogutta sp.]